MEVKRKRGRYPHYITRLGHSDVSANLDKQLRANKEYNCSVLVWPRSS